MTKTITIQEVYKELKEIKEKMVSKEEVNQLIETMEILHNPETMHQIKASEIDILEGRTKKIHSVKELLVET